MIETKTKGTEKNAPFDADREGELREPVWAVISFDRCEARDLSYHAAREKIDELEKAGVAGLCLVTNAAAARIRTR